MTEQFTILRVNILQKYITQSYHGNMLLKYVTESDYGVSFMGRMYDRSLRHQPLRHTLGCGGVKTRGEAPFTPLQDKAQDEFKRASLM